MSEKRAKDNMDTDGEDDSKTEVVAKEEYLNLIEGTKIILKKPGAEYFSTYVVKSSATIKAMELTPSLQPISRFEPRGKVPKKIEVLKEPKPRKEEQDERNHRFICCLPECCSSKIFNFAQSNGLSRHNTKNHPNTSAALQSISLYILV